MSTLPLKTVDIRRLAMCSVARQIIDDPLYAEFKLSPPVRPQVEVIGDSVIRGLGNCQAALRAGEATVAVWDRTDLIDEDPGVFSIIAGRDVIPSTDDPLVAALGYRWVKWEIATLPKLGTREKRKVHLRVHRETRAERLARLYEAHFGHPPRVLHQFSLVLDAPPEVRQAYRDGKLSSTQVAAVVRAGSVAALAVAHAILAGVAPAEAALRFAVRRR